IACDDGERLHVSCFIFVGDDDLRNGNLASLVAPKDGFAEPYAFMPGPDEAFAFKALLHPDSLLLECRALDGVTGTHVEHSPRGRIDIQPSAVDIDAHDE